MERVTPATPQPLQDAVEDFVAARRALSDRESRPAWFHAWKSTVDPEVFVDGSIGGDYACPPSVTMATVLPFFDFGDIEETPARPAMVPVKHLVGSSWRWHEGSLPNDRISVQATIDLFTSERCAKAGGLGAQVAMVAPIGMFYVAGEGKNRVAFLARQGVEFMPCTLHERSYPAADRLRIVTVREGPMRCWLCVLDDEFVVTIPYPEFTLPILRAYGVQETGWLDSYPMQATVMSSFRLQQAESDRALRSSPTKPLCLSHLKQREAKAQPAAEHMTSLVSHPGLALDRKYLRRLLAAAGGVVLAGAVYPSGQVILSGCCRQSQRHLAGQ
ncbi:MAG: hypothetical protein EKK53_25540 [Burkholderiales bacterium]|nr:MAG: hypothetical protein EKK53_25540 [Burkholderiales bacterium]